MTDEQLLAALGEGAQQPRGIRNNNPLNLEASVPWNGMAGSDGRFAVFNSMDDGLAAADRNLQTYATKHGLNTVEGVIGRWAPASENDTGAYVQFVSNRLGVDPRAPLDMNDPNVRQTLAMAMAEHENGQPLAQPAADLSGMSDDELLAQLGGAGDTPVVEINKSTHPDHLAWRSGQDQGDVRPEDLPRKPKSQAAGFAVGVNQPLQKAQDLLDGIPGADLLGFGSGPNIVERLTGDRTRQEAAAGKDAWLEGLQDRFTPGKIGEFAGNMVGTLPTMALPGGVVPQGMAAGALLSQAEDAGGLVRDAAVGGLTSAGAAIGLGAAGDFAAKALSKAPKIMNPEQLHTAMKAAYKAVDDSGFVFSPAKAKAMAAEIEKLVADKGGRALYGDAWNMAQRVKALAGQKGGLPITQLEDLRGQIYEYLVKPAGGKEAELGRAMRTKIDDLIGGEAKSNVLLREARDLYSRFSKMRTVTDELGSADLRTSAAYSGANGDNTIRQRLRPLVDPTSGKRIKNATADEVKAVKKVVAGTFGQNRARELGALLDPRKLGGKLLTSGVVGGGVTSGGATLPLLAGLPVGMLATTVANRASRKNVDELLQLLAAGGSKSALTKLPTRASQAAEQVSETVRKAVPASVAGLLLPRPVKKGERRP
ncbi:hypothetical protein [Caulobacter sp. NIBR2454]|uniref:hypothetical protein n=1 Tax=Caulobacter sp. NIBR2454 TaxID=3015996 RepID=UPI0022B64FF7|nr:hypothetical protein [Caulobacter sp. NIBR2454]